MTWVQIEWHKIDQDKAQTRPVLFNPTGLTMITGTVRTRRPDFKSSDLTVSGVPGLKFSKAL